jgi:CPA1 family monovalent cation:H+ antiporter
MNSEHTYEFLVLLLMATVILELIARRLRLPPAAALIVGGVVLALTPGVPQIEIDPSLVMLVFLYPSEQGRKILSAARGNVGSWRSMRTRSTMPFWRCYG